MFQTAFQANAFQNNAFQIVLSPTPVFDTHDGFTPEEIRRAKRLDAKIVAKQKQNKLQSIQEVKADIPSVDTLELQRSISYLENQKLNLSKAVAFRQEALRIRNEYLALEAKRLANLDDEESILLLI